jgi:hypothetical protein
LEQARETDFDRSFKSKVCRFEIECFAATGAMMKRITMLLFVVVMMAAVPLAAQEGQDEKSFFSVTIPAYRIYPHAKGYVFTYRKNSIETARLFLPYEWFRRTPESNEVQAKGMLRVLGQGNTWPQVSIFYNDGQFSYVKLYIRPETTHESWGFITSGAKFGAEFENADPPVLNFRAPD